jgi:3-hydroxy-4-methylanthranilate adenylyltransferase
MIFRALIQFRTCDPEAALENITQTADLLQRSEVVRRDEWVDQVLLAGPGSEACLRFGRSTDRATLRTLVSKAQDSLAAAGLEPGGTVALRLPPSLGFVVMLLAAWRTGAQVSLLDHRLTPVEVDRALDRLASQVLVEADTGSHRVGGPALRGYAEVEPVAVPRASGRSARSGHVLIQLSSGSTGPSKVIARTAADLIAELDRYSRLPDFPRRGERIVLLSSMVHVLGLVGGLLYALHTGICLVLPERLTSAGILDAVTGAPEPTTVIGVPFYAEMLAAAAAPPKTPNLRRMIVAGELVRPGVPEAFTARYGVALGTMYGMTELGVIATDLSGRLRPEVEPVHGMDVAVADGELHIRKPDSPYLGDTDPARWSDGWLHTRDAADFDPETGRVVILGRRDSQVSIGGLKVDLTEVEQTLVALDTVAEAVVVFDGGAIEAYLVPSPGAGADAVRAQLAREIAGYKMPRRLRVLPALPRTTTGKILRDVAALRDAADAVPAAGRGHT